MPRCPRAETVAFKSVFWPLTRLSYACAVGRAEPSDQAGGDGDGDEGEERNHTSLLRPAIGTTSLRSGGWLTPWVPRDAEEIPVLWFLRVQTERKGGWGSRAPILPVPCEHRPEPRDCRIPKGVPLGLRLSAAEGREGSRFLSKANSTSLEPGLGRAYVTVTMSTMSRGAGVGLTAIQPSIFG